MTRLGTTEYMAPEILLCHTKDQPMEHKNGMVRTGVLWGKSEGVERCSQGAD